ncbi:MAG TPA: hypothetical protein DEF27_12840 [Oscillatoriales bacterium UBA8482]|nr:MAG: hypothetical protein AUK43_20975 [Oscillatoriales cyanobacterium CG2_30_40_61]HBW58630.1 hypothetical protein [Oscillatoriales bacterium UBA8482]
MTQNFEIRTELIEDWLIKKVDQLSQAIILEILETFAEFGPVYSQEKLPRTKIKFLFDGIFEIRVGQYRIAYFWNNSICYLLHGIKKQRDDWPHKDVQLVKKRKNSCLIQ